MLTRFQVQVVRWWLSDFDAWRRDCPAGGLGLEIYDLGIAIECERLGLIGLSLDHAKVTESL